MKSHHRAASSASDFLFSVIFSSRDSPCFLWVSYNESVSSVKKHLPPPLKASALSPCTALKSREGNEDDQKSLYLIVRHIKQ